MAQGEWHEVDLLSPLCHHCVKAQFKVGLCLNYCCYSCGGPGMWRGEVGRKEGLERDFGLQNLLVYCL